VIKNSQPFKKNYQKTAGGDFLTHTVDPISDTFYMNMLERQVTRVDIIPTHVRGTCYSVVDISRQRCRRSDSDSDSRR